MYTLLYNIKRIIAIFFRKLCIFGNWLFTTLIAILFGKTFNDILSGYRVFSKRFVKSFPCLSAGFEIETELTIHTLDLEIPVAELETPYYAREEGSFSKLSTLFFKYVLRQNKEAVGESSTLVSIGTSYLRHFRNYKKYPYSSL